MVTHRYRYKFVFGPICFKHCTFLDEQARICEGDLPHCLAGVVRGEEVRGRPLEGRRGTRDRGQQPQQPRRGEAGQPRGRLREPRRSQQAGDRPVRVAPRQPSNGVAGCPEGNGAWLLVRGLVKRPGKASPNRLSNSTLEFHQTTYQNPFPITHTSSTIIFYLKFK